MNEKELEDWRCAISHKSHLLLPEDYHPLLWLYKEQRELKMRLDAAREEISRKLASGYHGYTDKQRAAAEDEMMLAHIRKEYIRARRKFLRALRDQEALDKDTEDTLESVRPPFC